MLANRLADLDHIILAAHQRGALQRKVVSHCLKRTQRREGTGSNLEHALASRQVLQPMLTKIHQPNVIDQTGG